MDNDIFSDNNFMPLWYWVKREHDIGESDIIFAMFYFLKCFQTFSNCFLVFLVQNWPWAIFKYFMLYTSKMWARNEQDLNDKLNKKISLILVYLVNPLSERYSINVATTRQIWVTSMYIC